MSSGTIRQVEPSHRDEGPQSIPGTGGVHTFELGSEMEASCKHKQHGCQLPYEAGGSKSSAGLGGHNRAVDSTARYAVDSGRRTMCAYSGARLLALVGESGTWAGTSSSLFVLTSLDAVLRQTAASCGNRGVSGPTGHTQFPLVTLCIPFASEAMPPELRASSGRSMEVPRSLGILLPLKDFRNTKSSQLRFLTDS